MYEVFNAINFTLIITEDVVPKRTIRGSFCILANLNTKGIEYLIKLLVGVK